jgi:predicted DNA-binding transcriptional regulator AlpA
MPVMQDELFRSPLAAKYLTLSKQTLDLWRCQGRGPKFLKVGRAVCYRRSDLDQWLNGQVRHSTQEDRSIKTAGDQGVGY